MPNFATAIQVSGTGCKNVLLLYQRAASGDNVFFKPVNFLQKKALSSFALALARLHRMERTKE
jgi:hypothetical protein